MSENPIYIFSLGHVCETTIELPIWLFLYLAYIGRIYDSLFKLLNKCLISVNLLDSYQLTIDQNFVTSKEYHKFII